MNEPLIRLWQPEDKPQLKALWKTGFGDPDEVIDQFWEMFLRPESCIVAEADGRVVSAMYILAGETFFPYRRNILTANYTYALATLPEYRSRGIGRAVYKAASDKALETADAACVLPAEKALYPFYENATGAKPFSAIREARFQKADLAGVTPCMAARVPALTYGAMREELLGRMPYVTYPLEFFEFLEASGMDFFLLENGLAAAETSDGVCVVRELLDPGEDVMRSVAGVARWCPASEYIVRSPVFYEGPGEVQPYMLGVLKQTPAYPMPDDMWWGFGLE